MYFYFTLSDEKSKYAEKTAPRGAATKNLDKPDFIVVNEVFFQRKAGEQSVGNGSC